MMNSYSRKVLRIPYFSEQPIKVIEGLTITLKEELYLKRDVVKESGVQGNGLVIVAVGVMSVYTCSHVETGHLIDGDYFGELSLVTDKEIRSSYVVAIINCKLCPLCSLISDIVLFGTKTMPCLKICTTLSRSQIPIDFLDRVVPVLARTLNKPEKKFICVITPDCMINFHGDKHIPSAAASLESIGHIDASRNKVVMKELSEFITKELGITPERFFLTFYDVANYNVGISGTTMG